MRKHSLGSPRNRPLGSLRRRHPPRLTIDSGDEVADTVSGGLGGAPSARPRDIEKLSPSKAAHLTGLIAMRRRARRHAGGEDKQRTHRRRVPSRETRRPPGGVNFNTQRNIPIDREAMACKLPGASMFRSAHSSVSSPLRPRRNADASRPSRLRSGGNMDNKEFLAGTYSRFGRSITLNTDGTYTAKGFADTTSGKWRNEDYYNFSHQQPASTTHRHARQKNVPASLLCWFGRGTFRSIL